MTLTGPQKYPGADISHWYEKAFPGDSMESNVGVVHTTEGATLPTYSGGSVAPNFTLMPDFASKTLKVYQHFDFDVSSRALVNAAGGVQTNTLNVVQFELVGTCDPKTHKDWNDKKVQHVYWPAAADWALLEFAKVVRWAYDNHAVPMTSTVTWKAYPDSYGAKNGVRLSNAAWTSYRGWLGHQHVPENLHGDPGAFPMAQVLAYAKAKTWATPVRPTVKDTTVTMTTADANALLGVQVDDPTTPDGSMVTLRGLLWQTGKDVADLKAQIAALAAKLETKD